MIAFILKGLLLLNVYALMWFTVDLSFCFIYGSLVGILACLWLLEFVSVFIKQGSDE